MFYLTPHITPLCQELSTSVADLICLNALTPHIETIFLLLTIMIMQNMDSYILHWWGWKLSRVWFLKWVCCVPPNIVSSRVSPQHQSSAVTISLQKLTFSAFISFITLKRFKPTKHNISVSITCSPSQRSKISNVDTFMQEFDRNYDSLTSPQKNHTRKEYCCWTLKSPSLIFEEPMMKESKNTRLTILRQNSNISGPYKVQIPGARLRWSTTG